MGGAEVQVFRLARALTRLGVEVMICGAYKKSAVQEDGGIHLMRIPPYDFLPRYAGGMAYLLLTFFHLWRARSEYDLIQAYGIVDSGPAAAIAGRALKKPVIARALCGGEFGDVAKLQRGYLPRLRRQLLMKVTRYVALSEQIGSELLGLGLDGRQVVAIPNGVDVSVFYPWVEDRRALRRGLGFSGEDKMVMFVGRLAPQKRVDLLIVAFRQIRDRLPEARLVLVGDGPLRSELEQLVVRLGLERSVIFAGNRLDVAAYMQVSDVFVLPSEAEGMSNAVLEAMACGLPVLVSDCAGNRELVTDGLNGMVFPRGSENALAKKIETLLLDTTYAQRLARVAIEKVQSQFRLESVAARYLELYRTVLSQNSVMTEKTSMSCC
jgi:glycosyltransferase involved in cell wall biosynthesis